MLIATFDLEAIAQLRAGSYLFRDRRPNLYGTILALSVATPP